LRTREVIAVEALARWDHPSLGPVAPQSFIAAAELSGDIDEIGRWVLSSACAQRAKWAGDLGGRPLDLRVNVSPVQLSDPNLPQDVAQVLRDTGMRPDELFLEITEGSEPTDALALIDAVDRLRGMGVRIAIDDFGVGRNGLLRLREMPVDLLKIDRAFVVGLRRGSRDSAIVEAVIGLARSLKIEVVAEGVQAPEAVTELLRLGCQRGQGYLLGPPMAADEIAAVIATPGNS
jgi:EAL domain-containing protein (putative c-di-GMP-specific phosphodiesterase class I)